jgi:hypothetical protein
MELFDFIRFRHVRRFTPKQKSNSNPDACAKDFASAKSGRTWILPGNYPIGAAAVRV